MRRVAALGPVRNGFLGPARQKMDRIVEPPERDRLAMLLGSNNGLAAVPAGGVQRRRTEQEISSVGISGLSIGAVVVLFSGESAGPRGRSPPQISWRKGEGVSGQRSRWAASRQP
jgi:hypothetical protein